MLTLSIEPREQTKAISSSLKIKTVHFISQVTHYSETILHHFHCCCRRSKHWWWPILSCLLPVEESSFFQVAFATKAL